MAKLPENKHQQKYLSTVAQKCNFSKFLMSTKKRFELLVILGKTVTCPKF